MDTLLSMKIEAGETFTATLADIGNCTIRSVRVMKKIAASTFQLGFPEDMRQLMSRTEEYKRLEDDRQQNKGKALIMS